jgi:ProP effector
MTDRERPPALATRGGRGQGASLTEPRHPSTPKAPREDSWRTVASAAIALLAEQFPRAFFVYEARRQPLKVGIFDDLFAKVHGAVKPHELSAALRLYTQSRGYLRNLRAGATRIGLNGEAAGAVSAEEAARAAETLATRLLRAARRQTAATASKPKTGTTAAPGTPRAGLRGLKEAWRRR